MANISRPPNQEEILAQEKYMELQMEEMLGEVNKYYASKKFKREVSDSEAIMYYIESGASKDFFNQYGSLICPVSNPENKKP